MQTFFRSVSYVPILKWKSGERRALATMPKRQRGRMVPLFLMPPSGDFDHDAKRRLNPSEHVKFFATRLRNCGHPLVFVDAINVDDDVHRSGLTGHPLTELLEQARTAEAFACPATTMNRSPEYQEAVRKFAERDVNLPICIRVTPLDIGSTEFAANLLSLLEQFGCGPRRVVLVLDFSTLGMLKAEEVGPFAEVLEQRLYSLPHALGWLKIVTAFTSFPNPLNVKTDETKLFPRTDWMVFNRLIERVPDLIQSVAFGDYALDSSPFEVIKGRPVPSAQIRYTTSTDYLVVKGKQAKKPVGYKAIYPVAKLVAGREEFVGPSFSEGDAFINRLAQPEPMTGTGNASTWRWAATDHHFAHVLRDLRVLAGEVEEAPVEPVFQTQLF